MAASHRPINTPPPQFFFSFFFFFPQRRLLCDDTTDYPEYSCLLWKLVLVALPYSQNVYMKLICEFSLLFCIYNTTPRPRSPLPLLGKDSHDENFFLHSQFPR